MYNFSKSIFLINLIVIFLEATENNDALVIDGESNNQCEAIVQELSKTSAASDFLRRKEQLTQRYLESLKSITLPEQLEYMERHFQPINSTLAAIKDANTNIEITPLKLKMHVAANKNIVPQRRFYSTKKKKSRKNIKTSIKTKISTDELNNNAIQLLSGIKVSSDAAVKQNEEDD